MTSRCWSAPKKELARDATTFVDDPHVAVDEADVRPLIEQVEPRSQLRRSRLVVAVQQRAPEMAGRLADAVVESLDRCPCSVCG